MGEDVKLSVLGTESKGLTTDTIASLPSVTHKAQDNQEGNMGQYEVHFVMPTKRCLCTEFKS